MTVVSIWNRCARGCRRAGALPIALLLLVGPWCGRCLAQTPTYTIGGYVGLMGLEAQSDTAGDVIPVQGVTISDGTRTATTGPSGTYALSEPGTGHYTITVSSNTFAFVNSSQIVVIDAAGTTTVPDFIAGAKSLTVNTVADGAVEGQTSLRAVLGALDNGMTASNPTIAFTPGLTGVMTLIDGPLYVGASATIVGPGLGLTVSGNLAGGVFDVFDPEFATDTVTISGLTIANGEVESDNSDFPSGAGLSIVDDNVTLTNCALNGNSAQGTGGGIYSESSTLALNYCTLSGNDAQAGGGGIENEGGTVTVLGSTLSTNTSDVNGGALENDNTQTTATSTVINSTFANNLAIGNGGAIENDSDLDGASSLSLVNCTFAGNSGANAGAIDNQGTLTLLNTLLATNSGGNFQNSGSVISLGDNLSQDAAGGDTTTGPGGLLNAAGDQRNTNPLLDTRGLNNNGGLTDTIALQATSPAVDAGNSSVVGSPYNLQFDQRGNGFPRLSGASVDIGAYELQPAAPPPNSFTVSGTVEVNGALTQGVVVSISGSGISDGGSLAAATNSSGAYSFLVPSGTYTLTASYNETVFSPSSIGPEDIESNTTEQNFVGTQTYTIGGVVTDASSHPIANVTVSLNTGQSTTTNTNGDYSIAGLGNGTYLVTASSTSYSFSGGQSVRIQGADQPAVDFTAVVFVISGQVTSNGVPLPGVTVAATFTGGALTSQTTDSNGNYSFSSVPNGTYTVTPSLTHYTFTPTPPPTVTISNDSATGVNFVGTNAGASPIVVSRTNGSLVLGRVRLIFSGALDPTTAGSASHFTVLISGQSTPILSENYNPEGSVVTLFFKRPQTATTATVRWSGLLSKGNELPLNVGQVSVNVR